MQIWKEITNYEGWYQVSNDGLVRSMPRSVKYKHGGKDRFWPSKIITPWKPKNGYLTVRLKKSGEWKNKMVHRLIAETFLDNERGCPQVNHKNGIKSDNNLDNLEWVFQTENMKHAVETGKSKGRTPVHHRSRQILDTKTNIYYGSLKLAAEAKGLTSSELCGMLRGRISNKSGMRYI